MEKLTRTVLAIGILSTIVGGSLAGMDLNRWDTVFLQFGIVYVVVGGIAIIEQRWQELNQRRLLLALSLPSLITGCLVILLLGSGTPFYDVYPQTASPSILAIWMVPVAIVPFQYVLGRPIGDRYRWTIAAFTALLVATPVVYYGITLPPSQLGDELATVSLVIALGFWTSIFPFKLGKAVASKLNHPRSLTPQPIIFVSIMPLILLAIASFVSFGVPGDAGSAILSIILYGPIVYVGVYGLSVATVPSA